MSFVPASLHLSWGTKLVAIAMRHHWRALWLLAEGTIRHGPSCSWLGVQLFMGRGGC